MDMAVRSHTARASLAWRLAAGVAALVTAASLGGPAYAEEATPNSSQAAQTPAVATSQAPDQQTASADGVAIQESGITFTMPATTQQNASGWWEYVDDDIKLYLKAFPNYASAPDLALDGPDEAWAKEYAQAKEAQERELTPSVSFDYVDHLDYQVGDTTFYAYLFLEQEEGKSPCVYFHAYVPLGASGSYTALVGFYFSDHINESADLVDDILATVRLDPSADVPGYAFSLGEYAVTLPGDIDFQIVEDEDGGINATFEGSDGPCAVVAYVEDIEDVTLTSLDDVQQLCDAMLASVVDSYEANGGSLVGSAVLTNDKSVNYYFASIISPGEDATFVMVPYSGTMLVVMVLDSGTSDDYDLATTVADEIASSIEFLPYTAALD